MTNLNGQNLNISLNSLKEGFREYLEDLAIQNGEENISPNASYSIFLHSEEFKTYLADEIGIDSSLLTKNINEILNNINDGTLLQELSDEEGSAATNLDEVLANLEAIELEANQPDDANPDEPIGVENPEESETLETDEPTETEDTSDIMSDLLSEIFQNEEVIKALDTDGVEGLSKEEMKAFLDAINLDDNLDELSLDELIEGVKSIYDGTYKDLIKNKDESELEPQDSKVEEDLKAPETQRATLTSDLSDYGRTSSTGRSSNGGYSGNNSGSSAPAQAVPKTIENMSLEELETEKTKRQTEVDNAQKEVDDINSGEKFKAEEDNVKRLEEAYKEALENDENTPPELLECIENIDKKEDEITESKSDISKLTTEIFNQQNVVNGLDTTLTSLKSMQAQLNAATSDNSEKQSEIEQKRSDIQAKINEVNVELTEQKGILADLEEQKQAKETALATQETELTQLKNDKERIETENKEKLSQASQEAMKNYNEAKAALEEKVKTAEVEAKEKLTLAQQELQKVNDKINEKKAQQTANEYNTTSLTIDINLNENLTQAQIAELETIQGIYDKNKETYEDISAQVFADTGILIPPEAICAIHYRESSCSFDRYLHNGDPLGKPTTHVPKGIYFENFRDSAVDALESELDSSYTSLCNKDGVPSDCSTLSSVLDYAERYNGTGYRSHGCKSAYVYSGTDVYTGGMYVADGQFSASAKDSRVGVAAIMKKLMNF